MLCILVFGTTAALATSNHDYGADEYATVAKGISPNGEYAITTHGEGELGYDHFHVYLTNARTGKKIGPLEEITGSLDTGADAFCAKWSDDSQQVAIIYRIDRHVPQKVVSYRIGKGRAFLIKGPVNATNELIAFWGSQCGTPRPREKVFGTPKAG